MLTMSSGGNHRNNIVDGDSNSEHLSEGSHALLLRVEKGHKLQVLGDEAVIVEARQLANVDCKASPPAAQHQWQEGR